MEGKERRRSMLRAVGASGGRRRGTKNYRRVSSDLGGGGVQKRKKKRTLKSVKGFEKNSSRYCESRKPKISVNPLGLSVLTLIV